MNGPSDRTVDEIEASRSRRAVKGEKEKRRSGSCPSFSLRTFVLPFQEGRKGEAGVRSRTDVKEERAARLPSPPNGRLTIIGPLETS